MLANGSADHTTVPFLHKDTLFAVDGNDDGTHDQDTRTMLASGLTSHKPATPTGTHSVRFEDTVQVIAPPLRSTYASRETEYELDSDELDDDALRSLESATSATTAARVMPISSSRRSRGRDNEQSMPLLVGLFDSSAAQRSLNTSSRIPLSQPGTNALIGEDTLDLDEIAAKRTAGGGMMDSIANMANSILGAGIIGLPYAVRQAGFFTGLFLLAILCIVTDWTIRLIVINAKLSGRHSYIEIMNHCFGSSGRAAVSFFQFSFAFGGMCAFGIIIGDTLPHVLRSLFPSLAHIPVLSLLHNRQFVIAFCTICISYPLSLYRDIHKLARASGLALIGMFIIVGSVLIEGPHVPEEIKGDPSKRLTFIGDGVFQAIGVISFAFVCHHNSLLIYGSLRTPTLDRFARVTHVSTFLSLVSCMTLAISAYVVFTDKTQGNILNNFPANDTVINIARFAFGMNMFTTLPLELFVCREVVEQFFFSHETFNMQRHIFFTSVILFSSMFVSLITCDLGVMLEITGGVSATALAYIFPAGCFLRLTSSPTSAPSTYTPLSTDDSNNTPSYTANTNPAESHRYRKCLRIAAYACAGFGIIVMLISLYLALKKSWTAEGKAKICM